VIVFGDIQIRGFPYVRVSLTGEHGMLVSPLHNTNMMFPFASLLYKMGYKDVYFVESPSISIT
jgi:hypothetical protein